MIHQYKSNGYNIVMDVESGAVHVVDDVTYDVIALFEDTETSKIVERLSDKYDKADIEEAISEVNQLKEDGQLFTQDIYQPFIEEFKDKRQTVVKALCLHIAHDCNLACKYCFAEEGEYHGRRAMMSFEVGKKALDFLVANSGSRVNLEVDFFGGEPLMNWDVVKQLVEYGRSLEESNHKKFRFTLTTNGVLLNDEIMEYLNKEMSNVVLSLDGRKEVNDRMRPFRTGKGSYDLIVPKFQKLAESRNQSNYYVRGTFTRDNLDFSEDVKHFADLGFKQMSIEPVVAEQQAYADPHGVETRQHKNAERDKRQRRHAARHASGLFADDLVSFQCHFSFRSLSLALRSVSLRKSRRLHAATAMPSTMPTITTPFPSEKRLLSHSAPKQQRIGGVTTDTPTCVK